MNTTNHQQALLKEGFSVIDAVYTEEEVENILSCIRIDGASNNNFRKSNALFAIRQFFKEFPSCQKLIFNSRLKSIVREIIGEKAFVVKSNYFDKPAASNWFVAYHQDLSISVDKKVELIDFAAWTIKQNHFAVQPPLNILNNITTIRIHLDDTDENNGALKVIPKSHLKNICKPQTINLSEETATYCKVNKGGLMLMKPLLLHSSERSTNNKQRRVIHIEFTTVELPEALQWAERTGIPN